MMVSARIGAPGGAMSATESTPREQGDFLQKLRSRIDTLAGQLRQRRTRGWDAGGLEQLAHEVERLHTAASRVDAQWANALAQLRGPLTAARQGQRLPDPAATAGLLATAEQLLARLPANGVAPSVRAAPTLPTATRAETPPPQYWRRWADDAPPPRMPDSPHPSPMPMSQEVSLDLDEPPFRVLIVEDDRAQALFAEGVLNGAGIEALIASDPADVLDIMKRVHPDLVLMDLHMPGLSGTELTAMIRQHEEFLHTPIVFLTGDPDPETQFAVLECGADDFLQKPIRPRHLIAAVESRIKRARAVGRRRQGGGERHPSTGLLARPHLLQRLSAALPAADGRGGVLFVEIEGAASLRERYGYAALETAMTEAGRRLARLAGEHPAARLNDNGFLVLVPDLAPERLEDYARSLRDGLAHEPVDLGADAIRLRAAVGHVALRHGFRDAGEVLEAAEQTARAARNTPIGLAAYTPPERAAPTPELAERLRRALAEQRFELAYQPIVAVAGGDEAQYQTLLRLRDENGALHSAADFVPAAEAAGLIPDIDRWVLERALTVLEQRTREHRPVRLFVPQAPRTLARDGYADWLAGEIGARGLEAPRLVLDLRLADALIHSLTLRQFCERLVPVGVQFCLSAYEHSAEADALLAQLPLGYLRLSARYAGSNGDGALRDEMRLVIERAHRLGLQVIGHHVEDPQAAATLWMSGIDYIQGNLVQQAAGELDFDFQHAVL